MLDTESSDLKTLDSDFRRYDDFVRLGTASDYLMEQLYIAPGLQAPPTKPRQPRTASRVTEGMGLLLQLLYNNALNLKYKF